MTKELEVVKQELHATKEQTKRSLIISNALIVLMLVLICFYMHYAKIKNLESELMAKIINLEIQHNITQDKKDQITQTLMLQLQRLEEKCSTRKCTLKVNLKVY